MTSRPRDTWLLVGAVGLSAAGDFLALIPLALELQESTGSGIVVSALFIALWSPVVLLAAPAGLVADRFDNRRLLVIGSVFQGFVALALAFSTSSTAAILALTAVLGAGFAFVQPAEFALAPAVAGSPERLTVVNGYIETARYAGMTVGPLLGGLIAAAGRHPHRDPHRRGHVRRGRPRGGAPERYATARATRARRPSGTRPRRRVGALQGPRARNRDAGGLRLAAVHDGVRHRRGVLREGRSRRRRRRLRRADQLLVRGHGDRRARGWHEGSASPRWPPPAWRPWSCRVWASPCPCSGSPCPSPWRCTRWAGSATG